MERLSQLIGAEISVLVLQELKDPRVTGITITEVRVTPDLSLARVYFAASENVSSEAGKGLARATPFLRRELGKRLRLRRVPELRFYNDDALEHGMRVDAILKDLSEGGES